MRAVWLLVVAGAMACSATPVEVPARAVGRTDVVLQWNEQVMATGGPHLERTLAMVHLAMFDAMNAVTPRYQPYLRLPSPPDGALTDVVAAGAAYGVLMRLAADQAFPLTAALDRSLTTIPDSLVRANSLKYGDAVAQAIYDARFGDGILLPNTVIPAGTTPGAYRLTTENAQPVHTQARNWLPFALQSTAQFRPAGPPSLTSPEYARDFVEVLDIGRLARPRRSPDEEVVARWHIEHGHLQLNRAARSAAASDGRDVLEHARLFALLNVAMADAHAGVFEAKYTYSFWRPVTAIRRAAEDGNDRTAPDIVWSPFLPTPPHPEYPSAHAAVQSAGVRILTNYFGPAYAFEATSAAVPGVTRRYSSFEAFAKEGGESRIIAGLHFRTSIDHGRTMGERTGDWVLTHALGPKNQR